MIYSLALLFLFPKLLFQRLFLGKYRGNFLQRLGINFPKIDKNGRKLIWLHAVSLGETKGITPLAAKLKSQMPEALFLVSSITETGHAEAVKNIPFAAYHLFLPFDLAWIIRPIMRRLSPDYVVLSETDLWKNFLQGAREAGAKIALVNGKLSEKTCRNYQRFPVAGKIMWPNIDLFCVQSEIYQKRFVQAGAPQNQVVVTGNIKHDRKINTLDEEGKREWRSKFGIDDKLLVVACTHDPEEKLVLEALQSIWQTFPRVKVLLAPRHPERFDEVAELIQRAQIPMQRYSSLNSNPTEKLFLIDKMGLLDPCYQIADLAIVAGSFTERVGGHNILEPCAHGTPVLFGPFMKAQPDMVELIKEYQAGKQITAEQIAQEITHLLSHEEERFALAKNALRMMEDCRGATDRTLCAILSLWQITPSAIV